MENNIQELIQFINENIDSANLLTYFYACIVGALILLGFIILFDIVFWIPTSIAKKNYLNKCKSKTKLRLYEYSHINIFNCWKYLKNGKSNSKNKVR